MKKREKKRGNIFDTNDLVMKCFEVDHDVEIDHPSGLRLTVPPDAFDQDATIKIRSSQSPKLIWTDKALEIEASSLSTAKIAVSFKLDAAIGDEELNRPILAFFEIADGCGAEIVAAPIVRSGEAKNIEMRAEAEIDLLRESPRRTLGFGFVMPSPKIERLFHPVHHYFKMAEGLPDKYDNGACRRAGSVSAMGVLCESPKSQSLYPACYPAAWAILCSAFRMTPQNPRRRWEIGTPTEANPVPIEFGDPFSTWVMGDEDIGAKPPPATLVELWRADVSDPTPEPAEFITMPRFLLDGSGTLDEQIERRAALIKLALLRIVGGTDLGLIRPGLIPPRPAVICHEGHSWVVVGVDEGGYWAHAQNNDAWAFSDWCPWDRAVWAAPKPVFDEHDSAYYEIIYPAVTSLKPEERRLGSIAFQESSDQRPRIRFEDVVFPGDFEDSDGDPVTMVHWTPHTHAEDTGYFWIESNVPLNRSGLPSAHREFMWDEVFGRKLLRPIVAPDECSCGSPDGCSRCRLRLVLPFWVHNTTLDELVGYRLNLQLWLATGRWVDLDASLTPHSRAGNYPGAPTPLPREHFEIQAVADTNPDPGRAHPWSSAPIAWQIDLTRDQLTAEAVQGIRLSLSCLDRGGAPVCALQDFKQLWFRVTHTGPD